MKNKMLFGVVVAVLLAAALMALVPCFAETQDIQLVTVEAEMPSDSNLTPQISWWARLMASVGLGPLAAIAGVVLAVLTSGVVIVAVCLADRRKKKQNRSK